MTPPKSNTFTRTSIPMIRMSPMRSPTHVAVDTRTHSLSIANTRRGPLRLSEARALSSQTKGRITFANSPMGRLVASLRLGSLRQRCCRRDDGEAKHCSHKTLADHCTSPWSGSVVVAGCRRVPRQQQLQLSQDGAARRPVVRSIADLRRYATPNEVIAGTSTSFHVCDLDACR